MAHIGDLEKQKFTQDSGVNANVTLGTKLDSANDSVTAIPGASASATGLDTYFNSALSNTVQAVKASAGAIYGFEFSNGSGGSGVYVQVFNVAAGSVTLGTTTPKQSFYVPAAGANDKTFFIPITCGTAISIAATTTATGSSAPGTAIVANVQYK